MSLLISLFLLCICATATFGVKEEGNVYKCDVYRLSTLFLKYIQLSIGKKTDEFSVIYYGPQDIKQVKQFSFEDTVYYKAKSDDMFEGSDIVCPTDGKNFEPTYNKDGSFELRNLYVLITNSPNEHVLKNLQQMANDCKKKLSLFKYLIVGFLRVRRNGKNYRQSDFDFYGDILNEAINSPNIILRYMKHTANRKNANENDYNIGISLHNKFQPVFNHNHGDVSIDQYAVFYFGTARGLGEIVIHKDAFTTYAGVVNEKYGYSAAPVTMNEKDIKIHAEELIFNELSQKKECPGNKNIRNYYLFSYFSPCEECMAQILDFAEYCPRVQISITYKVPFTDVHVSARMIEESKKKVVMLKLKPTE